MSATEILELSATAATAAVASGALSEEELFGAYLARAEDDRAAGGDGLNCFTWVAEHASGHGGGTLRRVPPAGQDPFCTEGVPSPARPRNPPGDPPPSTPNLLSALP